MKIIVNSVINTNEGITKHAREEVKELKKQGHDIFLYNTFYSSMFDKDDILKQCFSPIDVSTDDYIMYIVQPPIRENNLSMSLAGNINHKKLVYFLAFESELPANWVEVINKSSASLVLVPSTYCVDTFKKSGVKKEIKVLPHGVDLKPSTTNDMVFPQDEGFRYLWSGTAHNRRKGLIYLLNIWDKVLEKYPNSYLYIKINPIYGIDQGHNALLEKLQHMKNVAIITQQLSDEQMKELFTKVDCYVSPHLSEGFGMQMLEAMATETPIICSSWSGNMDFCNKRNAYLIKSRGKIAVNEYIYQDIEWQLPDERDFLLKMIEVQQNHKKRKKIIKEGLKTAQQYSWKKIGKQLEKYLQSVK